MLRSQSGPVAGIPFSTTPSSCLTRLELALFRVLLQRRLSLPLLLTERTCRSGRLLELTHGQECWRGFSLKSTAARVCREVGERVAWPPKLFVRDMDLGVRNAHDNRRLEVVADGLPLFGGVQLAVDTLVSVKVTARGELLTGVWCPNGLAGGKTCPGGSGGGRQLFVQLLAEARTRSEPLLMRRRMEQAWRLRWFSILSCAAARLRSFPVGAPWRTSVDGHTLPEKKKHVSEGRPKLC